MNTKMIAAVSTVLAATAAAYVPAAQAGGGHRGFHHYYRPYVWTPTFEDSYEDRRKRVVEKVYVEKTPAEKVVVVKYVDGQGRQYDLAGKVWFDGKSQCWSGQKAFAFKGGSWFYGTDPWKQVNGTWQTTAADAPAPVACDSVAAFAGKVQPIAAAKDDGQPKPEQKDAAQAKAAPAEAATKTKTADSGAKPADSGPRTETPAKTAECKKYFPSVGELVSVPCGE